MVAVKSREERFIVTGKAQTIQSKVEKGFRLEVPERSLPARSHVVLKVLFKEAMINHKRSLNIIKGCWVCRVNKKSLYKRNTESS